MLGSSSKVLRSGRAAPRGFPRAEPRPVPTANEAEVALTSAGITRSAMAHVSAQRAPTREGVGQAHSGLCPPRAASSPAGIFNQVPLTAPTAAPRDAVSQFFVEQVVLALKRRLKKQVPEENVGNLGINLP